MNNKPVIPVASVEDNDKQRWEELTEIHNTIVSGIYDITSQLQHLLNSAKEIPESKDDFVLIQATKTLTSDIVEFTNSLTELKKRYEDKKGYVKDGDELALALDIFNDYVLLNDRFKSITLEPLLTITNRVTNLVNMVKKDD